MTPDLAQAAAFLKSLDPDATSFTFQTFDDDSGRKDNRLARMFHGTLAEHAASLSDMQRRGAGVFITINATDGVGRKAENITRVRALWLDLDGAPIEPVQEWETPHIEVESSPGKWHAYWLVNDVTLDQFTPLQAALITKFNGDPSVKDLPRVMRLPGFWHLKPASVQHMSRVTRTSSHDAGTFHKRLMVEAPVMPAPRRDTPSSLAEVEELLSHISPDLEADSQGGDKHWHTIIAAIVDVSGGSDDGLHVADVWSSRSRHYDPKELRKRFASFTPGKNGGSGMGTIGYHARQAGADVAAIGARHRLMNMPGPSHVPAGMLAAPGMPSAPRAASVVDLICARIKDNPLTAVELLADEIARLSPADREKVFEECKLYPGLGKAKMQAAVKRAVTVFLAAKGALALQTPEYAELSHYFIVRNEDGQAVAVDGRGGMQPQARKQFRDAMAQLPPIMIEDKATGNARAKLAADYWWEHPDTLSYHATGYDPLTGVEFYDDKARKIRNVYEPGHAAPAPAVGLESIAPFMHIIRVNFPDASDQHTLLQILGNLVQRPGVMLRWAPVMQGTQGCGKGTIFQAVAYCHGRKNVAHPSPDVIATDFNGYMDRKTLILVNEIGDHSKRELSVLSEKIKPWITDDDAHIHGKGKGSYDTQNFTNWIFTTNHLHCMLATLGERRYAHFISVLQTEDDAARAFYAEWWTGGAADWWGSYYDWWGAGGAEAVRGYLGHMALDVAPSRAPVTSSTAEAMHAGDGAAIGLIRAAVTEGAAGFRGGWVSINAVRDLLESEDLKVPGGPYLARQLEQIGYRHTIRCNTSPLEADRFRKAATKTRLYHTADLTGQGPANTMALYDAAQRLGDSGPLRSTVIKMPGL